MTKIISHINNFLKLETTAGVFLFFAAAAAMFASNSFLLPYYEGFLSTPIHLQTGEMEISKPLLLWINDGLMAIFFLLVGLEIKREVLEGELNGWHKASLPLLAAIGGMVGPALIFLAFNQASPKNLIGWAIPAATDIAFALGILALLGSRVPVALKVLLLAIAIIDDLGAILIIALFYTGDLAVNALLVGAAAFAGLMALNRLGVKKITPYMVIGAVLWVAILKSGVHATLAGVLLAMAIPLRGKTDDAPAPLHVLEHKLHPWVAFFILPLFAFSNAGVSLSGITLSDLLSPLPLGIMLGLFLGKQLGVMGILYLGVKLRIGKLPEGVLWPQVYGLSLLTGVGFTMSLFIGGLAFTDPATMDAVRLGVISGSLLSGVTGFMVLYLARLKVPKPLATQLAE